MGTTCASFHFRSLGAADDAAKALARAYTAQGYRRDKKLVKGAKRVILLARPGEQYMSVFDSDNASLDNGELKEAALNVSRLLKTAAVFTSLYDSDSYECILFSNGRQVDALMTDAETYEGPLKILKGKPRVTQWSKAFYRGFSTGQIEAAATQNGAFAEASLTGMANLIELPSDRPLLHFDDMADEAGAGATVLYFTKTAIAAQPEIDGSIVLRNYFDQHNSRKLMVYPAAWPMSVGREEILTWLMLSDGAGFSGGFADFRVTGPSGLSFTKGFMNGAKFHNGQIVGGYELPANADLETAKAYLETKKFALVPAASEELGPNLLGRRSQSLRAAHDAGAHDPDPAGSANSCRGRSGWRMGIRNSASPRRRGASPYFASGAAKRLCTRLATHYHGSKSQGRLRYEGHP